MRLLTLILVLTFGAAPLAASLAPEDGDMFGDLNWAEAGDGAVIHLLAVYPYRLPPSLENFRVLAPENPRTRHGALLTHIILADGSWLQAALVAEGRAMVMPIFEVDPARLEHLLEIEARARLARKGLWGARPVVCAGFARNAFDSFSLVQGRVLDVANVRGTTYLNFGSEWRDDFTVKIEKSAFNKLPGPVQAELTRLTAAEKPDIVIEARGWVFFSGGPMIEVMVPAQFEILGPASDKIIEGCAS